jgi:PAS domain S-box-containing protein
MMADSSNEQLAGRRRVQPKKTAASPKVTTRLAEERRRLKASEERFRTLIEQAGDALQLLDAKGRSLYTSDSLKHVIGSTADELQGKVIKRYIHPEDRRGFAAAWRKILKHQGDSQTLQYRMRHADGQWVWLEATMTNHLQTPNVEAVVGNLRNINVRKQFEEQLRTSERRFRFMAESMPQKIFTMRPDGAISYFNPQWEAYTGITNDKLMHDGTGWGKVIHSDDIPPLTKVWQAALHKPKQIEYEFRMKRHDGEYRWHFGRMRPMKNEEGEAIVWIGSVTDIHDMRLATERRHELELRTAALTEQRAQLMALNQAKDEFISLASHQLRTPATGVKQYLGMLLEGYAGPLSQDQRSFIETAYESNERQITIVNDLLQVARIDAGKIILNPTKIDLVRMVKNVINEHASRFHEHDQNVALKAKEDSVEVKVDPDRIRMVLDNIIDNASKYTADGKRITITIGRHAKSAYVSVSDEGIGMTSADIDKIFQKFSRLENPHAKGVEGSGLGLYWARKVIDLHDGTIKVKSKVGHGTIFTIELPL